MVAIVVHESDNAIAQGNFPVDLEAPADAFEDRQSVLDGLVTDP